LNDPTRTPQDSEAAVAEVTVWDLPIRVVHWSIVVLLVALIVTGKVGADWLEWHMRFGQALLALVVFRVLWGFVGSRNARFGAFLHSPGRVVRYARSIVRGGKEVHVTHNPLGGWMVVLLLAALLAQAVTGLFTNDDILWEGPLASRVSEALSDAISTVHRQFWWVVAALSIVHVGAVVAYLVLWRDNLIVPMWTGRKRLPPGAADPAHASASTARAVVMLVLCGLAVWYVVNRLWPPPSL
jgi:cytochrome b